MPRVSPRETATLSKFFTASGGVVLFITGVAKIISALGTSLALKETDPIIGVSLRNLFLIVGVLEVTVSAVCILQKNPDLAVKLVAWIATMFITYRFGLWLLDWHRPCHCLGDLTRAIHISSQTADRIAKGALAYLFVGSYYLLFRPASSRKYEL